MNDKIEATLKQLQDSPETIEFDQIINLIQTNYDYSPTQFENGEGESKVINAAGTNEGSCKIFAFAQVNNLNKQQTLNCFGSYYREDVVKNPTGTDHANIRNFINSSWAGIEFVEFPLREK